MKRVLHGFGVLVAVMLAMYAVQMIAAESAEVVVLTTETSSGEAQETRLWIVDHEGSQWLRSGGEIQSWYRNILEKTDVEVLRDSEKTSYTALPTENYREAVNGLMREKYGWADSYIGFFFSRDNAIPIRLVPRDR